MVDVAEGTLGHQDLAELLYSISTAQLSMDEVRRMSFEQIAAIDDPLRLASTGSISPMLVRYVVCTDQLHSRFEGCSVTALLEAIDHAWQKVEWSQLLGQTMVNKERDVVTDKYLDDLQSHIDKYLKSK